jgi:hypothetical protein
MGEFSRRCVPSTRRDTVAGMPFGLPSFSLANIAGSVLFSGIGYIAFSYGKKMDNMRMMIQGGVLMGYSYMVPSTLWMYLIGTALTGWVWMTRFE